MPRHYEDFTGREINGVKVIGVVPDSGGAGKHKRWICECPNCRKEFITQSNHLKTKTTTYCAKCLRGLREDLTGQKFYHLKVDFMIDVGKYERALCSCSCDCGATGVVVQANHLKSGETKSCGCLLSFPEEMIASILSENNVKFEKQKTFPGLKYKNALRCDFYLPEYNLVIEYNGEQHYMPIDFYGGEKAYAVTAERDKAKEDYCREHNINYLTIRFDEDIKEKLIQNNIIQ